MLAGDAPAFRCTEIRQNGPFGAAPEACARPCGVAQAMANAERAWRDSLAGVTVADLAADTDATRQQAVRLWLRP